MTIAAATHRPGWRTGIALISSGRPDGGAGSVVAVALSTGTTEANGMRPRLADRSVDLRVGDRARLNPPLRQDGLVGPVRHQLLERVEDRLRHTVPLRDCDAMG